MNSESVVRNICESMRECLMDAKKARGNAREFNVFITRARRWQEMLEDYVTAQEARKLFLQAYNDVFSISRRNSR